MLVDAVNRILFENALRLLQTLTFNCNGYSEDGDDGVIVCVQGPVYSIEWSPFCPEMFLSCSGDWSIRLWHQERMEPILTFHSSTVRLVFYQDKICCADTMNRDHESYLSYTAYVLCRISMAFM